MHYIAIHGEGNGKLLQYSCLENHMDRGAWWATVHGVTRVGHHHYHHHIPIQNKKFWTLFIEWRGGARHWSRAMVGESGLEMC